MWKTMKNGSEKKNEKKETIKKNWKIKTKTGEKMENIEKTKRWKNNSEKKISQYRLPPHK
jgi:hypothetical protein